MSQRILMLIVSALLTIMSACSSSQRTSASSPHVHSAHEVQSPSLRGEIELPKDFGYPNGIALGTDGSLFIGSITQGSILRRRPDSSIEVFYEGSEDVFAATSLRIDSRRGLLWGASPDFLGSRDADGVLSKRPHRLFAISLHTGELVWSMPVPEQGFGNDLALNDEGRVFVTDSSLGRVWTIDPDTFEMTVWLENELLIQGKLGPAGLSWTPEGDLLVGLFSEGQIYRVDGQDRTVSRIFSDVNLTHADGMYVMQDGRVLILDAALGGDGRVLMLSEEVEGHSRVDVLAQGLDAPVNLTVRESQGEFWVTESRISHMLDESTRKDVPGSFVVRHLSIPDAAVGELNSDPVSLASFPSDFFPESVALSAGGTFFVGSAKRGEIVQVRPGGEPEVWAQDPALMSVQGMFVDEPGHRLYVCTADLGVSLKSGQPSALLAFDLRSKARMGLWPLPPASVCNDMVDDGRGGLLVTNTTQPHVLRFSRKDERLEVWFEDPRLGSASFNGNGIARDHASGDVFINTFAEGKLFRIKVNADGAAVDMAQIALPRALDGADGMRLISPQELLIFENGLIGGVGGVTRAIVQGDQATLESILVSDAQPTSGVYTGAHIVYLASQFNFLFGAGAGSPAPASALRRLNVPVR